MKLKTAPKFNFFKKIVSFTTPANFIFIALRVHDLNLFVFPIGHDSKI